MLKVFYKLRNVIIKKKDIDNRRDKMTTNLAWIIAILTILIIYIIYLYKIR